MDAVRGLRADRYTHPRFARLERELLFASWQPACHVSDLPAPGTALRFDVAGRSAVLLRGRDGEIRAFLNVCRHRGSRLVDGDPRTGLAFCVQGRLRCPYHGWEYDDTGPLVHVPREDTYPGIDRSALGLEPLAVATWLGFVFVAFTPPALDVATLLGPVRAELVPYRFESLRRAGEPRVRRYQADWKLVVEHHLDSHHLETARPLVKSRVCGLVEFTPCGDDVLRITAPIGADGSAAWSARAYDHWLPTSTELPPDRRRLWAGYFLWPNSAFVVTPDRVVVSRVLPARTGQSLLRSVTYALPETSREMRLVRYVHERVVRRAAAQDQRIVERVQSGIASDDWTEGPLAATENGLRWFVERMRRAIPADSIGGGHEDQL